MFEASQMHMFKEIYLIWKSRVKGMKE